jgi:hypothetical protein
MKKRNRWGILRWPQVGYFKVAIGAFSLSGAAVPSIAEF